MGTTNVKTALEKLHDKWQQISYVKEHEWYNDCASIDRFLEDLEEIIGTINEDGQQEQDTQDVQNS